MQKELMRPCAKYVGATKHARSLKKKDIPAGISASSRQTGSHGAGMAEALVAGIGEEVVTDERQTCEVQKS
jgi:hypothetical protein